MTGIFMRVKRNGKWDSIEIDDLSEAELNEVFKDATKERIIMFMAGITGWMRENLVSASTSGGKHE